MLTGTAGVRKAETYTVEATLGEYPTHPEVDVCCCPGLYWLKNTRKGLVCSQSLSPGVLKRVGGFRLNFAGAGLAHFF